MVETLPAPKKRGRKKGTTSSYTISPTALAQRRENAATKYARTDEERAYNAKLIDHIMRIHEIAMNADRNDINTLKSCFVAYLQLCQQNGFNVSNMAAYSAMGFDTNGFNNWIKKDDPDIRQFGRFVKETCSMFREALIGNNKLNPVIGIFWQRNYDGLRNDTEQVQSMNSNEEDTTSAKAYREKYKNLIGE